MIPSGPLRTQNKQLEGADRGPVVAPVVPKTARTTAAGLADEEVSEARNDQEATGQRLKGEIPLIGFKFLAGAKCMLSVRPRNSSPKLICVAGP